GRGLIHDSTVARSQTYVNLNRRNPYVYICSTDSHRRNSMNQDPNMAFLDTPLPERPRTAGTSFLRKTPLNANGITCELSLRTSSCANNDIPEAVPKASSAGRFFGKFFCGP